MDAINIYSKIQTLVQNEARQIAQQVYSDKGTRYGVATVPAHTHTGVDTNRINQKDIVQGVKYTALILQDTSDNSTIGGIFNPIRISFQGFAANNADGSPATKRAIINGEINFGVCAKVSDITPPISISTSGPGKPFMQSSNYMYIDSSDLTKNRVGATTDAGNDSDGYFVFALDDTGTPFATIQATSYDNQAGVLFLTSVVGTNVKIQGAFNVT